MSEKKQEFTGQGDIINNAETEITLPEVSTLLNEMQNCDTERENLTNSKTYWDANAGKLSSVNSMLEITRDELQENIKRAEKSLSTLTDTCELLKIDIDKQQSENIRTISNLWDDISEKIANYALKFPQAFHVYSKENLMRDIEKNREDLKNITEEIKASKSIEEYMNTLDVPNEIIVKEITNVLNDLRSADNAVQNHRKFMEKDTEEKMNETKKISAAINELKTKLKAKNKDVFSM